MKKLALTFSLIFVAALTGNGQMISGWTFETSVPTTAGPHLAELGANPGQALGFHAGASTYSNPAGNGSAESFSSTNWAVGDYYQFSLSTVGFSNIFLTFSAFSSGTGPANFSLQYSTTGAGGAFTEFLPYQVTDTPGFTAATYRPQHQFTFDLGTVTALNNNANIAFRLVVTNNTGVNGSPIATTGTSRVDDFYVSANAPIVVPEPATYMLFGMGLLVCVQQFRRRRAGASK